MRSTARQERDADVSADAIAAILADYPAVAAAYLFGSVARGEAGPESDVDLGLVLRDRRTTALDCYRMLGDLASRLEVVTGGRPVDLVILDAQGPLFRHRVLEEGRRVYEADADRRVDFESETHSLYLDFLPTWRIATSEARR
jgi:predicted nucleotidyltransferase